MSAGIIFVLLLFQNHIKTCEVYLKQGYDEIIEINNPDNCQISHDKENLEFTTNCNLRFKMGFFNPENPDDNQQNFQCNGTLSTPKYMPILETHRCIRDKPSGKFYIQNYQVGNCTLTPRSLIVNGQCLLVAEKGSYFDDNIHIKTKNIECNIQNYRANSQEEIISREKDCEITHANIPPNGDIVVIKGRCALGAHSTSVSGYCEIAPALPNFISETKSRIPSKTFMLVCEESSDDIELVFGRFACYRVITPKHAPHMILSQNCLIDEEKLYYKDDCRVTISNGYFGKNTLEKTIDLVCDKSNPVLGDLLKSTLYQCPMPPIDYTNWEILFLVNTCKTTIKGSCYLEIRKGRQIKTAYGRTKTLHIGCNENNVANYTTIAIKKQRFTIHVKNGDQIIAQPFCADKTSSKIRIIIECELVAKDDYTILDKSGEKKTSIKVTLENKSLYSEIELVKRECPMPVIDHLDTSGCEITDGKLVGSCEPVLKEGFILENPQIKLFCGKKGQFKASGSLKLLEKCSLLEVTTNLYHEPSNYFEYVNCPITNGKFIDRCEIVGNDNFGFEVLSGEVFKRVELSCPRNDDFGPKLIIVRHTGRVSDRYLKQLAMILACSLMMIFLVFIFFLIIQTCA